MSQTAIDAITDQPALDAIAKPLSKAVHSVFDEAGPGGRVAKNALHGVWLGHAVHPVMTDIPLGAWTTALALDACADGDPGMRRASTFAMGLGLLGALGAAVTGLTDWSETDGHARRQGLVHGLLNVAATALTAAAYFQRRSSSRDRGRPCAWLGYGIALGSAYLGGSLVYGQRIGVNHAVTDQPETFTSIADCDEVADQAMHHAKKDDTDVLLVRQLGRVCALAHACSHLGGPLSEGTLKDGSVVCPWHGSEFALDDGAVIDGPATHAQPVFDVRERAGKIQIKTSK